MSTSGGDEPLRTRGPQADGPNFGEEDRRLSYGTYLKIDQILTAQRPLAEPAAHDELLFIIVHQAYELWFRQILFELESVRSLVADGDTHAAGHLLRRVHQIERVMIHQIPVLESMSPQDFLAFRQELAPASGFQSVQFREIEFISGLKDRRYLARLTGQPEEMGRLRRRLDEPTLWDAFCSLLERRGLPMPHEDAERRRESLVAMARDRARYREEFALSEELLTHDELIALWRQQHVLMVERQIGSKTGTGGSTGAGYLRSTLDKRFFPELWELRTYL